MNDDEILGLFLEESLEHLDGIAEALVELEKKGDLYEADDVNVIFRAMHISSPFGIRKEFIDSVFKYKGELVSVLKTENLLMEEVS